MASKAELDLVAKLDDQVSKGLGNISDKVGDLGGSGGFGGLKDKIGGFVGGLGGIGLAAGGFGAITDGIGGLVGGLNEAADAAAGEKLANDQLLQSITNADKAYKGGAAGLNDMVSAGEALAFKDDDVRASLEKLTAATGDVSKAQDLQSLAMDVARSKHVSLETATAALAKAQEGSLGGLEKLGVQIDKTSTLESALKELHSETAGAAELFATSSEGAGLRAAEAMQNAKETIGAAILPLKEQIMGGLATFLSSPAFTGAIQTAADLLGIVLGGAMNVLKGITDVVGPVIQTFIAIITSFFSSVGSQGDPLAPVTGGLSALAAIIQTAVQPVVDAVFAQLALFWTDIQPKLEAVWQQIQGVIQTVMPIVQSVIGAGLQFISDLWGNVWPGISQVLSGVWTVIQGVVQVAWSIVSGIIQTGLDLLSGNWSGAWTDLQNMLSGVWDGIKGIISGAWDIIQGLFNVVLGELKTIWDTAWGAISQTVTDIWNGITAWISSKLDEAKAYIDLATTLISSAWTVFWDGVGAKVTEIWNSITGWVSQQIDSVKTTISTTVAIIQTAWTTFWDGVGAKVTETWDALVLAVATQIVAVQSKIKEVSDGIGTAWSTFWDGVGATLSTAWSGLVTTVTDKIGEIKTFLGKVPGDILATVTSIGSGIIDGILQGIQDAWGNITSTIANLAKDLPQPIKDALGIHSPSQEMADQIGEPLMQGILQGAQAAQADLIGGLQQVMVTMLTTMQASMQAMQVSMATFFDPQLAGSIAYTWMQGWLVMSDFVRNQWSVSMLAIAQISMQQIRLAIQNEVAGFTQAGSMVGGAITGGMTAGIEAGRSGVINAAVATAQAALAAAKSALDIHSPSGKFADLGLMSALGFAGGLNAGRPAVQASLNNLLSIGAAPVVAGAGGYSPAVDRASVPAGGGRFSSSSAGRASETSEPRIIGGTHITIGSLSFSGGSAQENAEDFLGVMRSQGIAVSIGS